MTFAHLHVHTEYSLLDGFSNIKKLVKRVKEMGMPAVAITDHGTMHGVIEFFKAAKEEEIKPVIGLEAYLSARRMQDMDARLDKRSTHLLLLAENQTGYQNLLQIASAAQLEGFYYHPRIDREFLQAHSEGLIATSGCMAAEVPRALMEQGVDAAREKLDWYYEVFGPDRFFIELQQHNIPELQKLNRALIELGPHYQARYVATNDVHYINQEDSRLQDILLCIQTGSLLSEPNRFRMSDPSYYLRSPEEMQNLFSEVPGALSNTLLIAERCNVDLSTKGYKLPLFPVPEGYTAQTYLRELCEEGLKRLYGERVNDPVVRERLEYELSVIHDMGFDAYFLIVWDLCRHAREVGIWYNARGSAAGSMTAYTLDITVVEPINHGLIFERFLNPGRISMPDIDLDFQDDLRPKIMEYCAQKYGADKVAQIITFGTMGARGAIRDVGRVMDIPLSEVDRVSKLIPSLPGKGATIVEALEQVPELKKLYDETGYLKELIDTASRMEGVVRNAGTHAAGVIITDKPLIEYAPLNRPTSGSEETPIKTVCQFEMSIVEGLGLLKVDFLGLATLTIMQRACQLIEQRKHITFNLHNIPIDDPETFQLLGRGHTAGVFQLEGNGMTRYLMQMKPKNLDNVIAMVALFRPGPLEFIPKYIRRMHNEEPVTFINPALKPIFQETYGIPIYQEQIMRAAVDMAGYTLSESDELRKAIAKKQKEKLMKHREKFIKGAVERGVPKADAEAIFAEWEEFARYGFNKSHAADYGVIAVQTAWLKTHYTVEYMTALLSASKNDAAKVAFYVADCRSMGIDVLPPDINHSGWDFTIEDLPEGKVAIRFGMGAVKNVGQAPVELILQARSEGAFKDLNEFVRHVDLRQVGKRALECLIRVGALDSFGPRKALLEALDQMVSVSSSHFRAAQVGQMSFFGSIAGVEEEIRLSGDVVMDRRELLDWERELIGLYVSDHPLTPYLPVLQQKITHFSGQLSDAGAKEKVVVAGMVARFRPHQTKAGKPMGFATLEDIQGNIEMVLFPKTWEKYHKLLEMDRVLIAEGKVDNEGGDPKLLVDKLTLPDLSQIPVGEADTFAPEFSAPSGVSDVAPLEDEGGEGYPQPEISVAASVAEPVADGYENNIPPEPDDWDLMPPPEGVVEFAPVPVKKPAPEIPPAPQVTQKPQNQPPAAVKAEPVQVQNLASVESVAQGYASLSYILPPVGGLAGSIKKTEDQPRILTAVLRGCGEKVRDVRRLKNVHGILCSYPGKDRFVFQVIECGHVYQIEFPNETTGISPELIHRLADQVGEENIRVDSIQIQ